MNDLISVIVPIYNTEQYLQQCIESIQNQSYKNLQIILVNDGSPGDALSICHKYANIDERILIVDKENGGLSSARNAGMHVATGKYISFLDSDDFLEAFSLEFLHQAIQNCEADIAMMHQIDVDEAGMPISPVNPGHKVIAKYDSYVFLKKMCSRQLGTSACGKLFRKDILEGIEFDEGILNEDFLFLSNLLMNDEYKLVDIEYTGYNYRTTPNSISRSGFGKSLRDAVYNTERMKQKAEKLCPELVPYYGAYAVYQARSALLSMGRAIYKQESQFVKVCRNVMHVNRKYIRSSFMNQKDKLFCFAYLIFPWLSIQLSYLLRRK